MEGMKSCENFEKVVVVQRFTTPYDTSKIAQTERLEDFLKASKETAPPIVRVGFQEPVMVYYSSGTTGIPKAIVHGVGPLLLTTIKESVMHNDMSHKDIGLQYTTTGWIMWLGTINILIFGARMIAYDGSPMAPDLKVLLRIVEEQRVTKLGISPRWMGELMKNRIVPQKEADLSSLRLVGSTGMVLPDQMFEWFYDVGFPKHVHLGNISGGTDIVSIAQGGLSYWLWLIGYAGWLLRHR
jgi:acetoacetyl-CoA synthetase